MWADDNMIVKVSPQRAVPRAGAMLWASSSHCAPQLVNIKLLTPEFAYCTNGLVLRLSETSFYAERPR